MKKIFFSLLAIAAIASCAKTEDVYTEGQTEIQIAPVTSIATKANFKQAINGIDYPTNENFDVFAYWKNEPAGSAFTTGETNYLINEDFTGVEFVNKGVYWGGTTTYYWPKNGSLRFAAYSPADINMTHVLATDTYTLSDIVYPTNTANTYEILVAPTSESYTAQTAAEKVSVVFEHTLSWLTLQLKSTDVAADAFTVNEIIVNDIKYNGTLTANMAADIKKWDLEAATNNVFVFNRAAYTKGDIDDLATVTTAEKRYENVDYGFLVLPQETTTVTINFTQNELDGTPALTGQTVTIPLTLEADKNWEPGKHYIYTVIFDLDEILINPSVEEWEEVKVPVIDATSTEVTNQEELQAALSAGRNVRLTENINLTEPIVVGAPYVTKAAAVIDVTVDLNGKTITSPKDVFEVKAGTLTIVGDGNVKAAATNGEPYCAVWAYGDAVVNIYGGVYEAGHPEGDYNDLIYAKEYATINIYGGEFKNSGRENAFVLNLKDTDIATAAIKVYGGKYHNFDPSNNNSEKGGANFLAEGYGSYELEPGVWTVVKKTDEIQVNTEAALHDAAFHGANVILGKDITVNETVVVMGDLKINLFNKTITNKIENTATDIFVVKGALEVNGTGTIAAVTGNDGYTIISEGSVTLNGGTYKSGADSNGAANAVIYARGTGKVYVNGGYFPNEYNSRYVLNKKDDDKDNTVIEVKGGTFVGFNPAESLSEAPQANFVATGYKSIVTGENTWTVVAE